MRRTDKRLVGQEHDARQPRLAMKAYVTADEKTLEPTEGAATAVQAIHGDSFFAKKIQDGPKSSTTFGVKAKPPALPCKENVLVENGTAAPKSCLSPLKMHTPTAAGGLLPTCKISTATSATFDQPTLWFCQPRRRILRGRQLNTPCATAVSGGTSFLPPPGEGLCKSNQGKIWCSILAVLQVVSAPARFWEHGARCFVGMLCVKGLDEAAVFFGRRMTRESSCRKGKGESFTPYV